MIIDKDGSLPSFVFQQMLSGFIQMADRVDQTYLKFRFAKYKDSCLKIRINGFKRTQTNDTCKGFCQSKRRLRRHIVLCIVLFRFLANLRTREPPKRNPPVKIITFLIHLSFSCIIFSSVNPGDSSGANSLSNFLICSCNFI